MPAGPVIMASKHQSAWETLVFHALIPEIAVGLKEELTRIPVFGWYLMRAGNIRIDRGAAANAIRSLVRGAKQAVAQGLTVLIFPEGTRRAPEDPPDYKPGVAALYAALKLPVVPVALNSGLYWRRREFVKHPGRVAGRVPGADPGRPRAQGVHAPARAGDREPAPPDWWPRRAGPEPAEPRAGQPPAASLYARIQMPR